MQDELEQIKITPTASAGIAAGRREIISRFVLACAFAGLLLGIFEAAVLRTSPEIGVLLVPDIGRMEWFLAPLVDVACFGLWGLLQGWLAARWRRKLFIAILLAVDAGVFLAFVVLRLRGLYARIVIRKLTFGIDLLQTRVWFAAGFAVSLLALYLWWKPASKLAGRLSIRVLRYLSWSLGLAVVVAACGIVFLLAHPFPDSARIGPGPGGPSQQPNIIFIVLDTVRADHLSSYGYSRPTTPNLDRLARHGVMFQNAIASTSWTLPSHASMFTGLLPHQNGADWWLPLPPGPRTLAEVLRSQGYNTAGFVANYPYCQSGWGIARGFQIYGDGRESLVHNLAATLAGILLVQPLYNRFWRFDPPDRPDAAGINAEIFRWFGARPRQPFFLFLNYFDTHVQYYTRPPYSHRFGTISNRLVHKLFDALESQGPPFGFTAGEHASIIDGYDDCLAYLDAQIGRLLGFLDKSPEGRNTIVIITSDHGEEFGEHGYYSHGNDLYHDVIHVPLIIAGPGIPKNVRIRHLVRIRDLFSTVLDLAGGGNTPFSRESLARFWRPGFTPQPFDNFVVSELVPNFNEGGTKAMISLTTPDWQYIYDSGGRQELYRWTQDPLDQMDLAGFEGSQAVMAGLHHQLIQLIADSSGPWLDPNYLFARAPSRGSFLLDVLSARKSVPALSAPGRLFIGTSQSFFTHNESLAPIRPAKPDQELLKTLPYH